MNLLAGYLVEILSKRQIILIGIFIDYPQLKHTIMAQHTGKIGVQTENILPVIQKFLYSDNDIFLRELISNAVDATSKLKTLSSKGEFNGELGDLFVEVKVNKEEKTIQIIDRGIGMTQEEVEKYINQIAFSSAQEFAEKYQDEASVIGHFGLGFYSSFIVSDQVSIETLSFKEGASAVKWTSDGTSEYTIEDIEKEDRGTVITLHIQEDSEEFLEENRIDEVLNRYCKFLPVEIRFGEITETLETEQKEGEQKEGEEEEVKETITKPKVINGIQPLWKNAPADLTDEDYKAFYKELYPHSPEPLFWVHLNIDYPFNLTGVLYFPPVENSFELQKNKIQLYSNQVFVTDNVEEIVPEWLTLLHGVLDSPDIPLNVSRSYLQSDAQVRKITTYITKKVADKLNELFKADRDAFQEKWDSIGLFVKYGMLSDDKFFDKAKKFALYKDLDNAFYTQEELEAATKDNQTDKNDKFVQVYTSDADNQYSFIQSVQDHGYKVLRMDSVIDNHFVAHLEQKLDKWGFVRVDADTVDKLIEKEDSETSSVLTDDQKEAVKKEFGAVIGEESTIQVEVRDLSPSDMPVRLIQNEFFRRMGDMQKINGGKGAMEFFNLIVNGNHELIQKLTSETEESKKTLLLNQLYDLALLSQNKLKGERLAEFTKRSLGFIG